jgi:hypothetical protein
VDVVYAVLYVEDAVMRDAASRLSAQVMCQSQRVWHGQARPVTLQLQRAAGRPFLTRQCGSTLWVTHLTGWHVWMRC